MQISGMSLTFTRPLRLCLLRVHLGVTTTATNFPLSKHTRGGDTAPAFLGLCVYLQFTWEVGLSHSPVEFSSHHHFYKLSRSWLLGMCCRSCLLWSACEGLPLPSSTALRVPCPLCYMSFLLLLLIIQFFFSFFPGWWSVCPGGYADLAQGCLWEYHAPFSSPCGPCLPKPSGGSMGALLVSPFNVKWRCSAWAEGVEESKFCFFSVVFPVRCISSVSPRFYFRKHAFCFLPLAAILESPKS
jgi:hypothetical protein